jgi:succinate dehydrogenase / fumarate reductase, cytochrome b subunit
MATLVLTVTETLRYRGKLGQWSWALHRIAGLGTLLFLFLHVIDTSWAVFYPNLYSEAIAIYQSPLFTVGEFALVACVVFHALNGFRVVVFDARPQWWKYQAAAARAVFICTIVLLVPTFYLMFAHVWEHYQTSGVDLMLPELISSQSHFAFGAIGLLVGGIVISFVYSLVPGTNKSKLGKTSRYDRFMWVFMRVSGVIIIPLVFGHLGMVHVIQGVFDITTKGIVPVGTTLGPNVTGTAPEFVSMRWNTLFAGVFIWRLYDVGLLVLATIHGFNGLRYVVNDYVHNGVVNRGMQIAILATALGLNIVGGLAIVNTIPVSTVQLIEQGPNAVH